jgi:16S rRNA (guanine(966)-N(2))-methyltransferase RsmD
VRIVGGEYKGRIIEVSREFDSRPTTDFAREALFNILSNYFNFEEVSFLDLFGGTGSISYECYSRGCRKIDLVDLNSRSVQFISKTAAKMNMKGIHPVKIDVFRFLEVCKTKYNIIFADPPFELKALDKLPDNILSRDILSDEGWLILEHPKKYRFSEHPRFFDTRKYGNIHFSFFR